MRGAIPSHKTHGHHTKLAVDEEEPQELQVLEDETEPESDREIELELVGGELVQVHLASQHVPPVEHSLADLNQSSRRMPPNQREQTCAPEQEHKRQRHNTGICLPNLPQRYVRPYHDKTVDAAVDEQVLRIVLRHAPTIALSESTASAWDAVARDSRGRFLTGISACTHTAWLCKVLSRATHPQHANLSPRLRELLHTFRQFIGPQWPVLGQYSGTDDSIAIATTGLQSQRRRRRQPRFSVMVHASKDELLLELLIEWWPFLALQKFATVEGCDRYNDTWADIAQAVRNPLVNRECDALARVHFLTRVLETPTHRENGALTPTLRRLLATFHAKYAIYQAKYRQHGDAASDGKSKATTANEPRESSVLRVTQQDAEADHADDVEASVLLHKTRTGREDKAPGDDKESGKDQEEEEEEQQGEQAQGVSVGTKRKRSTSNLQVCDGTPSPPHAMISQSQLLLDHVSALQSEVTALRETFADEMAKNRAQLTLQGTHFEQERRAHRRQLRGVLEMLREEREAHTRETERLYTQHTQELAVLMRAITRSSTS